MKLSVLSFSSAPAADVRRGLLGWICVEVDHALVLDGIALRRTTDGRMALSFPERRDSNGRRHPIIRPLDDDARQAIERQVFQALGVKGDLP